MVQVIDYCTVLFDGILSLSTFQCVTQTSVMSYTLVVVELHTGTRLCSVFGACSPKIYLFIMKRQNES
jgi:hypothetical protein